LDSSRETTLSVFVPVYNEQHLVTASLKRLEVLGTSQFLRRIQVIVVDNGSTEGTAAVLNAFESSVDSAWGGGKFEWKFLHLKPNRGKGGAIQEALQYADGELCVIHDADLEYYPEDLLKMIPLFLDEDADAVYGSRFRGAVESQHLVRLRHMLGNRLATFLGALLSNLDLSDLACCYKMIRTELFRSIPFEYKDFRMDVEITLKVIKRRARIFEVPVRYTGRSLQQGKKLRLADVISSLFSILVIAFSMNLYRPDAHGSQTLSRLHYAPNYAAWVADMVREFVGQRVLEIGAGVGMLTAYLSPRELYWAADPNPLYVRNLQRLTSTEPYLRASLIDISRPETFPIGEEFDTVICRYSLESAQDDLFALRNVHRILKPGGVAIVIVPQGPNLFGSLDPPSLHLRRYSEAQLENLGVRAGFRPRKILPINRLSTPMWWWDSRVRKKANVDIGSVKLFNALVPILRRIDHALPFPPLSLIGVLEK
jgi:glycosyltransferase involved in cell wall biosynthesis